MTFLKHSSLFLAALFLLLSSSPPVDAQTPSGQRTVTVIGKTAAEGKDAAAVKQQAIDDALTTAIEVAALEMMAPEEAVARFGELDRMISGSQRDFIQTYEVLSSDANLRNRFRILVRAVVDLDLIRERLDASKSEAEPPEPEGTSPQLLILVAEQQTERGAVHYWWRDEEQPATVVSERAMAAVLSERGYRLIPHTALFQDPGTVARIRFNPYIEPGDAAAVGRNLGADVVIVGTAVARSSLAVMGEETRTFSATVSVRAFSTATGEEIAEATETSVESTLEDAPGRRAALEKAGASCGRQLAEELDAALSRSIAGPGAGLRLIVGGTRNLGNFVMFRRALRDIAGVDAIRLEEMRTNEAVLQLDYQGDGADLAKALAEKSFETFTLKIYDAAPGEVRVELVSP